MLNKCMWYWLWAAMYNSTDETFPLIGSRYWITDFQQAVLAKAKPTVATLYQFYLS